MDNSHDIIYGLAEVALFLTNQCGKTDYSQTIEDACSELSKHRWIPIEERLPEEDENVLVLIGTECSVMRIVNRDKTDVWHWDGSYCMMWANWNDTEYADICDASHWMPLPEPPQEVSQGG